jgi:hypothetical protein
MPSEPSHTPDTAGPAPQPPPRVPLSPPDSQTGLDPASHPEMTSPRPGEEQPPLEAPDTEQPLPGAPETSLDTGPWQGAPPPTRPEGGAPER